MSFRSMFALALMLTISTTSLAKGPKTETTCKMIMVDSVSLYVIEVVNRNDDIGKLYQSKVDAVYNLAKEHQWSHFKFLSQDVNLNQTTYGKESVEVSVSLRFQLESNFELVNQILAGTDAYSVSTSQYEEQVCS